MFIAENNALIFKKGNETLRIEPWGKDSLRVRASLNPKFLDDDKGLSEPVNHGTATIQLDKACDAQDLGTGVLPDANNADADGAGCAESNRAVITNGRIKACVSKNGLLSFYKDDKLLLKEYNRCYDPEATKHSCCIKVTRKKQRQQNTMLMTT